jgi:hypothetical protein
MFLWIEGKVEAERIKKYHTLNFVRVVAVSTHHSRHLTFFITRPAGHIPVMNVSHQSKYFIFNPDGVRITQQDTIASSYPTPSHKVHSIFWGGDPKRNINVSQHDQFPVDFSLTFNHFSQRNRKQCEKCPIAEVIKSVDSVESQSAEACRDGADAERGLVVKHKSGDWRPLDLRPHLSQDLLAQNGDHPSDRVQPPNHTHKGGSTCEFSLIPPGETTFEEWYERVTARDATRRREGELDGTKQFKGISAPRTRIWAKLWRWKRIQFRLTRRFLGECHGHLKLKPWLFQIELRTSMRLISFTHFFEYFTRNKLNDKPRQNQTLAPKVDPSASGWYWNWWKCWTSRGYATSPSNSRFRIPEWRVFPASIKDMFHHFENGMNWQFLAAKNMCIESEIIHRERRKCIFFEL